MSNYTIQLFIVFSLCLLYEKPFAQDVTENTKLAATANQLYQRPSSLGVLGDTTDVKTATKAGIVLMGGGKDVDAAFKWMIEKSGGGNVVIIRATGTNAYNKYVYDLGKVSSVETLKIDSRELANNDTVIRILRNAEMLWIAGGDQSNYMKFWKDTKTADAINYLINKKKVPVGGTSAGCAILGQIYYSGEGGSAVSKEVLADPFNKNVTLYKQDFLKVPYLQNVVTDQHYVARSRQGRHVVFLARMINDWNIYGRGIAADERTAVCIDGRGRAQVIGTSKAFFLSPHKKDKPEVCEPGNPLTWNQNNKALQVYEITGTPEGNGTFNVKNFKMKKASGGKWLTWWVENGELKEAAVD
jgi:cyanophycinase-like exopeptidase